MLRHDFPATVVDICQSSPLRHYQLDYYKKRLHYNQLCAFFVCTTMSDNDANVEDTYTSPSGARKRPRNAAKWKITVAKQQIHFGEE